MYMFSNWIVDGINNKLYKFTNDIIEGSYKININQSIGDAAVAVGTDERTIAVTCPTAGMVAWFDDGIDTFVKYTSVGGTPIGICEGIPYGDNKKPYFVANYSTDTVSIIKDGNVVQNIEVGKGPRSVATDGYGRVYVANFNSATVSILALTDNNKYAVYKTIDVDKYPNCVAVNHNDDAFVVCQNSIVKLRKDHSKVKFTVTGNPVNINADGYGNMWFTNLTDNSVMRITMQEQILPFISGGIGPVYIASDRNSDIICLNTGNKTLTRINEDGNVINTVNLDFIPMANGDFIGFISRVNILDDISRKDTKKIGWDDLDPELQEKIDNRIDPETFYMNADHVIYEEGGFSNVTEAINSLIYEYSSALTETIEQFEIEPAIAEVGSHVSSLTFNYKIQASGDIDLAMAEINNGVGVIPLNGRSYVISGLDISEEKEYKLIVRNNTLNTGEKTACIKFDKKIYYGISNVNITTGAGILDLSNSDFMQDDNNDSYKKEIIYTTGSGYIYLALPVSLGITIDDIFINGFRDSNWSVNDINMTNSSGHTEMYRLFKSGYTHNIDNYKIFVSINHAK